MHDFVVNQLLSVPDGYSSQHAFWQATSAATGISRRTIEKIARREIENPKVIGLQVLADHFGYRALLRRRPRRIQVAARP